MAPECPHLDEVREVRPRTPNGSEECLEMHASWVHLRLRLECGHVVCCDDSPYVDDLMFEPAPRPRRDS
jgi:hypothetical protein